MGDTTPPPGSTAPALHWHAYWWAGEELPDTADRDDPGTAVPPRTPGEWFRKPHVLHRGNHVTAATALEWLAGRLFFEVPHPHAPYAVSGLIETAEGRLGARQDVTWQYRSRRNRVVMAAMLTCPRPGYRCPQDPAPPPGPRPTGRTLLQAPAPAATGRL
ncbi:hypothetical protein [Streptomyces sp. NPDC085479]|uniref:hypothetical protein n=1 Tax=Streptomyces sp. NPDC085479 TaxID=3365726 RepID=UPI0037D25D7A